MPNFRAGRTITDTAQIVDGVVSTADIAADAITKEKIATAQIEADEIATGAVGEPEILDGAIVNTDINAAAEIVDTKLAQIATADKVSGAALTSLASIPAGAGVIPSANVPTPALDNIVFSRPTIAAGTGATIIVDTTHFTAMAKLENSDNEKSYFSVKVPTGYTSISAINIVYKSDNTGGTVNLRAKTSKIDGDAEAAAVTDTAISDVASTPPATAGQFKVQALAADNFGALGALGADDIIGIELNRDGATDSHTGIIYVAGVQFVFAA